MRCWITPTFRMLRWQVCRSKILSTLLPGNTTSTAFWPTSRIRRATDGIPVDSYACGAPRLANSWGFHQIIFASFPLAVRHLVQPDFFDAFVSNPIRQGCYAQEEQLRSVFGLCWSRTTATAGAFCIVERRPSMTRLRSHALRDSANWTIQVILPGGIPRETLTESHMLL